MVVSEGRRMCGTVRLLVALKLMNDMIGRQTYQRALVELTWDQAK